MTNIYLGRNVEGDRVWVEFAIEMRHDRPELHVTGRTVPKHCREGSNAGSFGQINLDPDALPRTTRAQRIGEVWDRWHLNGMRAECEHQRARGETYATHPGALCPECDYKLGSAWLHEELPAEIIDEVTNLWPGWGVEEPTRPVRP